MLYVTEISTDGNKQDSKNDYFWFKAVQILRHPFRTTKGRPKR